MIGWASSDIKLTSENRTSHYKNQRKARSWNLFSSRNGESDIIIIFNRASDKSGLARNYVGNFKTGAEFPFIYSCSCFVKS